MKRTLAVLLILAVGIVLAGWEEAAADNPAKAVVGAADAPGNDIATTKADAADQAFIDVAKLYAGHREFQRQMEALRTQFVQESNAMQAEFEKLRAEFDKADPESKPGIEQEMRARVKAFQKRVDDDFKHELSQLSEEA